MDKHDRFQFLCEETRSNSEPSHDAPTLSSRGLQQGITPVSLIAALRELQQVRGGWVQPARDVLEAEIQRAEEEAVEQHHPCDAQALERILHDLGRMDEEFLREAHARVSAMIAVFTRPRAQVSPDFVTVSQLDAILACVEVLRDFKKKLQSATITMLLQELNSFLRATAYRKVAILPQRLETIDKQLRAVVSMTEQWVTLGRLEGVSSKQLSRLEHTQGVDSHSGKKPASNRLNSQELRYRLWVQIL